MLITCVSVGIGGFSAMFASRIMKINMRKKLEQQTLTIAQVMCDHIVHNVIAKEIIPTREALMDMVHRSDDIEFIYVTDFDRNIFAHSFEGDFPRALLGDPYDRVSADKPLIRRYKTRTAFLLDLTYPIIDGMKADIHVVMNEGYTFTYANSLRNQILGVTLIITAFGILIGIVLSHRITHPLTELTDSMKAFGKKGVYSKLLPVGHGTEVDDLTNSFNSMITERKRAEMVLQRERDNLTNIFDSIEDGVYIVDKDYNIQYINPALLKEFGAVEGRKCYDYFDDRNDACPWCKIADVFAGKSVHWEWRSEKTGKIYDLIDTPVNNPDGTVSKLDIFRDITKRKRTEDALRESEDRYRSLVDNIPGVSYRCRCDEHWTMEFISDEIEKLSGYPATDFLQNSVRSYGSIINPEDRKISDRITLKGIARKEPFTVEYRIATAAGGFRWVYEKGQGIFNEQGEIQYLDGVIVDITERKRAEEALHAKTKEMETLLRAVSHDLRTPLVNIEGFSGELARDCEDLAEMLQDVKADAKTKKQIETLAGEQIPESLSFIRKGTQKMDGLLKGLSHLAKIGTVKLDIQRLDINDIAQQVVDVMKFSARKANATIELETLPDCHGDEVQINQVFSNLIGNAVKYLDPERAGRIRIWGKIEGNMSQYCVEDNGVGIPDHHKSKVFEIFHRVDPESPASGDGLGLTTTKQIVERHKGYIWLESEEGKGSKFFFTLPKA